MYKNCYKLGLKIMSYEHLWQLFQDCLNGADIPSKWKKPIMSTIHGNGSKDNVKIIAG